MVACWPAHLPTPTIRSRSFRLRVQLHGIGQLHRPGRKRKRSQLGRPWTDGPIPWRPSPDRGERDHGRDDAPAAACHSPSRPAPGPGCCPASQWWRTCPPPPPISRPASPPRWRWRPSCQVRTGEPPEVPSMDERGLPGHSVAAWLSFVASATTPEPVFERPNPGGACHPGPARAAARPVQPGWRSLAAVPGNLAG